MRRILPPPPETSCIRPCVTYTRVIPFYPVLFARQPIQMDSHQKGCNQGRSGRFEILPPPPELILCEIYLLISSFCLQKSYHTHQKQEITKVTGGGAGAPSLNNLGGHVIVPGPLWVHGENIRNGKTLRYSILLFHRCVMQLDMNSFSRDVVLESYGKTSWDKDINLEQIYEEKKHI